MNPPPRDLAGERFDRHSRDAHGVEVGREKDTGIRLVPGKSTDHIWSTGEDFFESDLCSETFEQLPHALGAIGLTRGPLTCRAIWIDARDADQLTQEVDGRIGKLHCRQSIGGGLENKIAKKLDSPVGFD